MNYSLKLKTLSSVKKTYQSANTNPRLASINQVSTSSPITNLSKSLKKQEKLMCAFHQQEKITNFCRSKACLLPLCPRCHIKLGVHGDFTTIEDEIIESQKLILLGMEKISQVEKLMIAKKQAYYNEISANKQTLKNARAQIHETVDNIMDDLEKAWCDQYELLNQKILQEIEYIAEYLPSLAELAHVGLNKLKNTQYVLEGVITNFSFFQEIKKLQTEQSKLNRQVIQKMTIHLQESQMSGFVDSLSKYITWGEQSVDAWKNIDSIYNQKDDTSLARPNKQLIRIGQQKQEQSNWRLNISDDKLQKNQSWERGLTLNLSLDTFKSPLQSFSLQHFRKNQNFQI